MCVFLSVLHIHVRSLSDDSACGKDGCTALLYACKKCHLSIAEYLLNSGVDPNPQDAVNRNVKFALYDTVSKQDGWTALMFACYWDSHSTVELLLNRGADHSICDSVRMVD